MAGPEDNKSTIGFETLDAINAIIRLKRELESYNSSMQKIAKGTGDLNREQIKAGQVLAKLADQGDITAATLNKLSNSYLRAQKEATKFAAAQAQAAKGSFVDPRTPTSPLARQVSDVQARKQAQAEREVAAAAKEAAKAEDQAAQAAQRLAAADQLAATSAGRLALAQGQKQTAFQRNLGLGTGAAQPFGDTLAGASQQKQQEQLRRTELALRNVAREGKKLGSDLNQGTKQGVEGAKSLEISWRSVIRVFGIQFAARATQQIVGIFTAGIKEAREFEIRLAEILTISPEFLQRGINAVGEVTTRLAAEFGRPVQDVAAGLYETISNQIGDAAESTRFLTEALQFSVASVTSAADSVRLLSGILNAYGLNAASAARITDQLFVTIDLGAATGKELADTIGRVITLAAQLGVRLEEVNAIFARLTIQGVDAADASTQLSNVLLKLIQPSVNTASAIRDLGFASAEAGIQSLGLIGFLDELTKLGGKLPSEVAELLGGRVRAIRGTVGIVGDLEKTNKILQEITESAGAAKRAFDIINQTDAQELTRKLEGAKAFIINDFGRPVIALFNNLLFSVNAAKVGVSLLGGAFGTLVSGGLLIFLANSVRSMKALGLVALGTAGTLQAVGLAIAPLAIISLGTLIYQLNKVKDISIDVKAKIQEIQDQADREIKLAVESVQPQIKQEQDLIRESTALLIDNSRLKIKLLDEERIANLRTQGLITSNLSEQLDKRDKEIEEFVKGLEKKRDSIKKSLEELPKALADSGKALADEAFERSVGNLSEEQQIFARTRQARALQEQALAAAQQGNQEKFIELIEESFEQAKQVANQVDSQAAGERLIASIRQTQINGTQVLIGLKTAEQKAIEGVLKAEGEVADKRREQEEIQKRLVEQSISLQRNIENALNAQQTLALQSQASKKIFDEAAAGVQKQVRQETRREIGIGTGGAIGPGLGAQKGITEAVNNANAAIRTQNALLGSAAANATNLERAMERAAVLQTPEALKEFADAFTDFNAAAKSLEPLGDAGAKTRSLMTDMGIIASQRLKLLQDIKVGNQALLEDQKIVSELNAAKADAALQNAEITEKLNAIKAEAAAAPQVPTPQAGVDPTTGAQTFINPFVKGAQDGAEAVKKLGDESSAAAPKVQALNESIDPQAPLIIVNPFTQAGQAAKTLGDGTKAAADGMLNLQQQATPAADSLNQILPAGQSAADGVQTSQSAANSYSTANIVAQNQAAIESYIALAQAAAAAGGAGGGGGGQGLARGGLAYFANGGFVPRGTDTVPAMLSPGEFVMNAASSKKFYSELVSMNLGRRPVYREEGGPVTNQSFGDVKINMPAQSAPVDIRQLAMELRRQIGLKTVRLS